MAAKMNSVIRQLSQSVSWTSCETEVDPPAALPGRHIVAYVLPRYVASFDRCTMSERVLTDAGHFESGMVDAEDFV